MHNWEIHIWDYDKIELIYNQFKMLQRKLFKRSNSLPLAGITDLIQLGWRQEPSKEEIIMTLIPKSLKTQLYKDQRFIRSWTRGARGIRLLWHKANRQCDWFEKRAWNWLTKPHVSTTTKFLEIVGGAEVERIRKNFIFSNLKSRSAGIIIINSHF
jgi:F-type H+-transporting ATPase subunit gamma